MEERYSRVLGLSDTRYSAKGTKDIQIPVTQLKGPKGNSDTRYSANGTKGKWRHASGKVRLYPLLS